jgi:hypothetical protein
MFVQQNARNKVAQGQRIKDKPRITPPARRHPADVVHITSLQQTRAITFYFE